MFKDFMEDYNTATFPSKKFYNLELHHRNKLAKAHARGQQAVQAEKVVFDDEAEKRWGLLILKSLHTIALRFLSALTAAKVME